MVELPSKPHNGSCSRVGNLSNSLICVLPRKFGVGVYPSSQIYSSLNLVIELSLVDDSCVDDAKVREPERQAHPTRVPGHHRPILTKHLMCQSLQCGIPARAPKSPT